jgi:hypothetical protein
VEDDYYLSGRIEVGERGGRKEEKEGREIVEKGDG